MIIEIRGDNVYCFVDHEFMIFSANRLITGAKEVGHCWPVGKIPYERRTENLLGVIKKDTCYHNMVVMELLKRQGYKRKELEDQNES